MRLLFGFLLAGCWSSAPAPLTPPPSSPPTTALVKPSLPCGVSAVDELVTFADHVGSCSVIEMGPYRDVMEDGRLVLRSGEAKPVIAFDRRIPGPHGIQVGMTAREVLARLPGYRWESCAPYSEHMLCELEMPGRPTPCESFNNPAAVEPVTVWFDTEGFPDVDPNQLSEEKIVGVVLAMPC